MFILFFNYGLILNYLTGSISHFYHFSITAALRISAKKDIFRMGGKRKIVVTGKFCGGRNRRIGGRRNGKRKRKDKMYVYKEQEFHAQNGVVRTLAISNKVQMTI